ncbi:MAG TPA: hypothetical protein VE010_21485 [Thermoanaerobaculia bacterium]|nr:hypothetical protein [Thermoanaerobaculia bacterium]
MRLRHLALLLATPFAAFTLSAQQPLLCSAAPAGRPCEAYHFHVQLYRPDSKQFVEVDGVNQFATQAACDRARDLHITSNANAVEYLRGIRKQYEADRVGPCHCDMTNEESAADFLSQAERNAQLRLREEVRLRLRERLLDEKLTSDSEIVRGLWAEPPVTPQLNAPKLAPMPQSAPQVVLTAPEDLKPTKTIDAAKPVVAALDLPLIDLAAPAPEPPPATAALGATEGEPAAPAPLAEPAPDEIVVAAPVAAEAHDADVAIESTIPEHDTQSAQETAERFVEYEKQRIQNILRASASITDEDVKSKIFEACMQRIQLLSNLRLLIEGSGMRSRLAAAAREAVEERDRIALIRRLFGDDVAPHWAPREAPEVIFEVDPAVAAEPERVLRDTTGNVSAAQKKRALYLVLTQSHPTEDQLLWLSAVVDEFLR